MPPRRSRILKLEDDETKKIVRSGAFEALRLIHWLGAGNRPLDPALGPPTVSGPKRLLVVAAAVLALGVAVLIFLGVIAVTLKVFEYGFAPIFDPIFNFVAGGLFRLVLMPGGLPILALIILAIGLPLARKFRHPSQFVRGLVGVALALVFVWQLVPRLAVASRSVEAAGQLGAPLLVGGLLITAFLFTGGIYLMASANDKSVIDESADEGSANDEDW